jgi:hypothetical protein
MLTAIPAAIGLLITAQRCSSVSCCEPQQECV